MKSEPQSQNIVESDSEERREGSRFLKEPDSAFAVIWREPGHEWLGEVHDESLHGLGLICDEQAALNLGDEVSLIFEGQLLRGLVRHIDFRNDGRRLIGLACTIEP